MRISTVHMTTLGICIGFLLFQPNFGSVNAQNLYTPDPESRIWIEGQSNVNRFTCRAEEYEGEAQLSGQIAVSEYEVTSKDVLLEIRIPVESFECGRSRMNRDLYDALKSEEYLFISFEYKDATNIIPDPEREKVFHLDISGILTVAGTSREINFHAEGYVLDDNRLRAIGKKEIRMTDFNVEPPTGLLGMIRARDELTVHFDLYASPEFDENL